jgi:hypothetical protein
MSVRLPIWLSILVILAALGARLGVMATVSHEPLDDPDNYLAIARSLASGHGYRLAGRLTAYRPPLYPLLLAPLARIARSDAALSRGALALNLALGLTCVGLTIATAHRWGLGPLGQAVAGLIVALDPVLVAQSRLAMTETLAATAVAAVLLIASRIERTGARSAACLGASLGLAALARPSLLAPASLIVLAALFCQPHAAPLLARLRWVAIAATILLALLAPWALRNRLALGHTVWTTTHGGYTLALGNNPPYFDTVLRGQPGQVFAGPSQHAWWRQLGRLTAQAHGDEVLADRILKDETLRVIRQRPADFARAVLDRLARFWGLAPSPGVYPTQVRLATALWTTPLWLALLAGLCRRELYAWPRIVAPAFLLGLTLVHAVYWTDLRMRAPIVPAIALVAGAALPGRFPYRRI